MSLFKAREFWSTQNDTEETYDRECLKIHLLNSDSDFIIIGSHGGLLQIFKPSTDITEENTIAGYSPSDLCVEVCLNSPVLQIEVGKLVSGSPLSQIAILHPLATSIYSYTSKDGNVNHGQQNMLNLLYEHKLRRYSANFVIGTFGGSKQREFLCVQSLDGMLSFFEQETFGFDCMLPNFLIPGPIVYCSKSDSFLTFSSNWNIESFSYKKLSEMGANKDSGSALKLEPDWCYNISEEVLHINCLNANNETNDCYLIILGSNNFQCINENGHIKFMKKLGYTPNCMTNYLLGNDKIFSLIISETNTLFIYHNTTLQWSAQLSFLPISIARTNLKNIKGALTFLSEEGRLQCVYLGTEPFLFSAPPLTNQQIDFEKTEEELSKLYKIIANSQNKDNNFVNATTERELMITIHINPHLETVDGNDDSPKKCKVIIEVMPQAIFEEINVVIYVEKPLIARPNSDFFINITDRVQFISEILYDEEVKADLATLEMTVVVTVISSAGVPRVVQKSATLPLNLAVSPCPPCKDSEHKITLNINDSPVAISTLFPEFIGENAITISSNATGFVNSSGSIVTLLAAKASQRYRLQSDSICALNLLVHEVIRRLMKHYTLQELFLVTYTATLPIAQVIERVREHFEARTAVKNCEKELGQLAAQFRLIQKRLISKYKDKNPTPMNNLDILLQDTYLENCDLTIKLVESTKRLELAQIYLSCILHLIQTLLSISDKIQDGKMNNIDKKSPVDNMLLINGNKTSPDASGTVKVPEVNLVMSALCCHALDFNEQSWEDVANAGICYLLRTKLATNDKDKLRAPHTSFEEIKELAKVEKHIGQIFERILNLDKTNSIIKEDDESIQKEDTSATTTSQIETEQQIKRLLPIGSTLAESSTRALSARKSLLRRRQKIQED